MTRARVALIESGFDVIVVGGGHAGAEAATAAARAGACVALITSALETIGQMSCNPAIGGVAKGTVVREIDALGGVMARATDAAMIQFRMLNRGKGPAVWAPRAQCDRGLYRRAVRRLLEERPEISLIQGTVRRLLFDGSSRTVTGVETMEGRRFAGSSVVITTGTFLRGRIHIGTDTQVAGGRAGEASTTHLAEQLAEMGLEVARFKTGTPPRIDGRSVNYSVLERQESELADFSFQWSAFGDSGNHSVATATRADRPVSNAAGAVPIVRRALRQVPCWITHAEARTKEVVATHIGESAMYGGTISARGPRYCPSIEDKVVRFPDAERHQLFLEPEGLDTSELYVNGLSTSLPAHVQIEMLHSVRGLEHAQMTRAGYAIEYDYYPPTQLWPWLEVRSTSGLFFAGQINGTTGYEEAGAQGVIAGLSAALRASGRDAVTLGRETSYIGVLVDDLIGRGVDEPYRLFTSRSEFRLTVRQENAIRRLAKVGLDLGLYTDEERRAIETRLDAEDRAMTLARDTSAPPVRVNALLDAAESSPLGHAVRIAELVKRQNVSLVALFEAIGIGGELDVEAVTSVELELKYAGYFEREREAADRMKRMGGFRLPPDAPYATMRTLSTESRQKLASRRPLSLAQAASIPGVSPSDLQNLVLEIERFRLASASAAAS